MVGLEDEEHKQHGEHLGRDPGRERRNEQLGEAAHLEQSAVARVLDGPRLGLHYVPRPQSHNGPKSLKGSNTGTCDTG